LKIQKARRRSLNGRTKIHSSRNDFQPGLDLSRAGRKKKEQSTLFLGRTPVARRDGGGLLKETMSPPTAAQT